MSPAFHTFEAPTQIRIGRGSAVANTSLARGKRVGLLASRSALGSAAGRAWLSALKSEAVAVSELRAAVPNPRIDDADAALDEARRDDVDLLIAFGGGSVLDAAKAVCLGLATGQSVREMAETAAASGAVRVPLVAIPTAFGTGAETSAGSILTDERTGSKKPLRDKRLVPSIAILDSHLSDGLSVDKVLLIGIDALFHAIETFHSRAASPVTDLIARSVLGTLPDTLLQIRERGLVAELVDALALASALMGTNLANSSTCLPHRMQYAVSKYPMSNHQRDLLAIYPSWLAALDRAEVPKLQESIEGVRRAVCPTNAKTERAADVFRIFRNRLGLTSTLRALGVTDGDAKILGSAVTGNVALDPLSPSVETISTIFQDAMKEVE